MSWLDELLGYKVFKNLAGNDLSQRSRVRVEGSIEATDDSGAGETVLTVAAGSAEFTTTRVIDNETGDTTLEASILNEVTLTAASPTYTLDSVTADPTLIGKAIRVLFVDVGAGTIAFAVAGGDTFAGPAVATPIDGTSLVFRAYAGTWFLESRAN
jgi:hypothetical protein